MTDYTTYGLLADNVSESVSPQIFNALFLELGIGAIYLPYTVPKDQFIAALPILRSHFSGFNVDSPYKLDIMPHLDSLDDTAKLVGAANTVSVQTGKTVGYNTEMPAFDRSLIGFAGNMFDRDVLLLGSGGAAYAMSVVLLEKGAFLTIVSRSLTDAMTLQAILQKRFNKNRIKVAKGIAHSDEFYAVFNSDRTDPEDKNTQISIHSHTYQSMKLAYDVSYKNNLFLKKAQEFGANIKNGFDLLFYNAIGAIKLWLDDHRKIDVALLTQIHDKIEKDLVKAASL